MQTSPLISEVESIIYSPLAYSPQVVADSCAGAIRLILWAISPSSPSLPLRLISLFAVNLCNNDQATTENRRLTCWYP